MKSYAEFLRGYMGKKGVWHSSGDGGQYEFSIDDNGNDKLVDVGTDYAEFSVKYRHTLVPLNLLVVRIDK